MTQLDPQFAGLLATLGISATHPLSPISAADVVRVLAVSRRQVYHLLASGRLQGPSGEPRRAFAGSVQEALLPSAAKADRPASGRQKAGKRKRADDAFRHYSETMERVRRLQAA